MKPWRQTRRRLRPCRRYDTGVGDQISVAEAQTTLESAQSAAINLGVARAQYEHAIATLIGKPASAFSIPVVPVTPRLRPSPGRSIATA
jgi:outer membrane protein TolC